MDEIKPLETRWFDSLDAAQVFFDSIKLGPAIIEPERDHFDRLITTSELKYRYEFRLNDKAKALIANEPKYDAERLAQDLSLDPMSGKLIGQVSGPSVSF